jgi:RecA/RadA recombinase
MFDNIQVIGSYPFIARKRTGLFSLDMALSGRGVLGAPMRSIYELYGYPNSGKSTLSYYLAGVLANQPEVAICDLELADMEYIHSAVGMSGFSGIVRLMDLQDEKKRAATHEQAMAQMVECLAGDAGSSILDSVGAIQPIAEAAGDFGEAFVGKRAKLVAQVARALSGALRLKDEEAVAFVINHTHQIIGGRGHTTAGGETLKYMAGVRIMIWTEEVIKDSKEENALGFVVGGQVEKLRFGGRGRSFNYYIVPGLGVHPGASAMFDCFALGLAKRDSVVKLDGKSMGYLKKDLLEYAMTGKSRKFEPFVEALAQYEETLKYAKETKDEDSNKRKGRKAKVETDTDSAETGSED